jgi:hypothetical protein
MTETVRFFQALPDVASPPAAVIFNRSLPPEWIDAPVPEGVDAHLASNLRRWSAEAKQQRTVRRELGERHAVPIATIPWQRRPPTDLDSLGALIEQADSLPELW